MNTRIKQRLEKCTTLPTLPAVAVEVLRLCQAEELNIRRISDVISTDPALALKVLKVANSPMFGLHRQVESVSHALSLLGANAVRGLVLSFSLMKECRNSKSCGISDYWRRSVLAAIAAREICVERKIREREEPFIAALLCDVGVLALIRALGAADYGPLLGRCEGDVELLAQVERSELDTDHVEVGAWLLEKWSVPERLRQIVSGSRVPPLLASDGWEAVRAESQVVSLSGLFADIWVRPDSGAAKERLQQQAAAIYGPDFNVDLVCARMLAAIPQVADLFEMHMDQQEMTAVLEQAQEAMVTAMARLESSIEHLRAEIQRDTLTGLPNRGQLETYLDQQFTAAMSSMSKMGVIFADIDHFKRVNDTYGHCCGDSVLRSVAQRLAGVLRKGDFVGRFGGEEFVVVLSGGGAPELVAVAERLRKAVAVSDHPLGDGRMIPVTVSLGCALLDPEDHRTGKDLMEDADRALYDAKHAGRNCVAVSPKTQAAGMAANWRLSPPPDRANRVGANAR